MDLRKYLSKWVKVDLVSGYYYEGFVLSCDINSIELRDKKGHLVDIKENVISFIREVENGN